MKSLRLSFLLLLCMGLFAFSGCGDDDDDDVIESLNYDDAPVTAPVLDANIFAAYFPPSEVQPFVGRDLETISFFLEAIPPSTRVWVFEEGTDGITPGPAIYQSPDLTQRVNAAGQFINHRLTTPLRLDGSGIWLAVETGLDPGENQQSVGCDDGRNFNPNGNRIRIGNQWLSFTDLAPTERVNWNIRGIIAEE